MAHAPSRARILVLPLLFAGLLMASCDGAEGAADYLRVKISDKASLLVQFRGGQLRMAPSAEGLAKADVIKPKRSAFRYILFPPSDLPLTKEQLPAGWRRVTAEFGSYTVSRTKRVIHGNLSLVLDDEKDPKTLWTYKLLLDVTPSDVPDRAPLLDLSGIKKLDATVTTETAGRAQREIGIGVTVKAGAFELVEVLKNDQAASLTVKVLDEKGAVVSSKTGKLDEFGFG